MEKKIDNQQFVKDQERKIFLDAVVTLNRAIQENQSLADRYLNGFNRIMKGAPFNFSFDISPEPGVHSDRHVWTVYRNDGNFQHTAELLQRLAEYHILIRNTLESELETLVRGRYLENSM